MKKKIRQGVYSKQLHTFLYGVKKNLQTTFIFNSEKKNFCLTNIKSCFRA